MRPLSALESVWTKLSQQSSTQPQLTLFSPVFSAGKLTGLLDDGGFPQLTGPPSSLILAVEGAFRHREGHDRHAFEVVFVVVKLHPEDAIISCVVVFETCSLPGRKKQMALEPISWVDCLVPKTWMKKGRNGPKVPYQLDKRAFKVHGQQRPVHQARQYDIAWEVSQLKYTPYVYLFVTNH